MAGTGSPESWFERGARLEEAGELAGARAAYRRAIALDPAHTEALASLAWLDAQAGDRPSALDLGQRALAIEPAHLLARMALASAELQDGRLDDAGHRLARLFADPGLASVNRAIVLGLIGDLNDAQGDSARAFKAYDAANRQLQALYPDLAAGQTALGHALRLAQWFATAAPEPWQEASATDHDLDAPRSHVFLVGFPRSGTTLLETVLAGHPDVVTIEEKDSLAAGAALMDSDDGLERLSHLDPYEAQPLRAAYWSQVRGHGIEPAGKVFIDKMPLATVLLPLIAKLFPDARVLFAVRDPRDVVLSCFRRRFGMNAAMAQFLSLKGAAAYYDAVMSLAEVYRKVLPVLELMVRHEDVVEDFEATVDRVCEFIGIDRTPAMIDIAATAGARAVTTPSAAQLARGLNREGQGAWRRYAEQMTPVLPVLEPWVKRFGY